MDTEIITWRDEIVKTHSKYIEFIERMKSAFCREKFMREDSLLQDSTPNTNLKASRYIIDSIDGKTIFICTPNLMFEELCDVLWSIAKEQEGRKVDPIILLEKLYIDFRFRVNFPDWEVLHWTKDFERFKSKLIEESFFYFDDLENQYYFNLFRKIDPFKKKNGSEFTGGILHALCKHFKNFSKFHPDSNDDNPFKYNTLLGTIIKCCISGESKNKKDNNSITGNYTIEKHIFMDNKKMRLGLYYECEKKLFYLNTAFISNLEVKGAVHE